MVKQSPKKCPKCGHDMETTLADESVFVKGFRKPFIITFLMYHCPNCMELMNEVVDNENARKYKKAIEKLCKKKPFVFR